ncbi:hypothetical protein ACFE04_022572 [Oxalis oulophora]
MSNAACSCLVKLSAQPRRRRRRRRRSQNLSTMQGNNSSRVPSDTLFEEQETPGSRSFFTEIIASISDIKFARDGRYIVSRDYMNLKLWDINMDSGPVSNFQVHEHLRPRLCDLYENDSIFDKFECCPSGDGLRVATGSYSFHERVFMEGLRFKIHILFGTNETYLFGTIKIKGSVGSGHWKTSDDGMGVFSYVEYIVTLESLPKATMLDLFQRR